MCILISGRLLTRLWVPKGQKLISFVPSVMEHYSRCLVKISWIKEVIHEDHLL